MRDQLTEDFQERLQEIEAYLDLLEAVEQSAQNGPPRIGQAAITSQQQKILYSSVYLQLYNLIEATVNWCIEAVADATIHGGKWQPRDLSTELRREWVRTVARTDAALNEEHRLGSAVELCEHLIKPLPLVKWKLERRRAGSWDDQQIESITKRLGCTMRLTKKVRSGIKKKIRDDKPPLVLIKDFRNRLAHGSISFGECGEGHTVVDLRQITKLTASYLAEVIDAFKDYIAAHEFLQPSSRPA